MVETDGLYQACTVALDLFYELDDVFGCDGVWRRQEAGGV